MHSPTPSLTLPGLTSFGVFTVLTLMFAVPSGYSYGAVILLLLGVWLMIQKPAHRTLQHADRLMIGTLCLYFVVSSLMTALLGNNPTDYDQYSRALLAVPIFLLLLRIPVSLHVLWCGVILGICFAAPLAWWQVNIQGEPRAAGFLNVIHFGNLCMVFTMLATGGLCWASQHKHPWRWYLGFGVAILCGLYSVALGGSRGSWVAVPPVVVIFLLTFLTRRNAKVVGLIGLLATVAIVVAFAIPGSPLKSRYKQGIHDIVQYQQENANTSIGARFEMWRGAWENLQVHPVLGWNTLEYTQALKAQVDTNELMPIALQFSDNLHNNYLHAWVFTGLPGLLVLLALYCVPLWHFGRYLRDADLTSRVLAFCGTSVVVSYLCFSLTQVILRRNNGIMFYLLVVIIFWAALHHALQNKSHRCPKQ